MAAPWCPTSVVVVPPTIPSDAPLGRMLARRPHPHRDRQLEHVLGALRAQGGGDSAPRSLLDAIAGLSAAPPTRRRRRS